LLDSGRKKRRVIGSAQANDAVHDRKDISRAMVDLHEQPMF
jgi:hypothetical protein